MAKILIADDSQFMRKLLKDILVRGGYNDLIEAANGKEALEKYEKEKPDLVLLDIIMPEVDGTEVLEKLNKSDIEKIIIITAVGQEKMKDKAKALEVEHYIVKPFEEKEVLKEVKKILE